MNVQTAIAAFEERVAQEGRLPDQVRLTRYVKFDDWYLPEEDGIATPADFEAAQRTTDEFAEYLTRRGITVRGVNFSAKRYHAWRKGRPDCRNLRAEWANGRRLLLVTFKISDNAIGWSVIAD